MLSFREWLVEQDLSEDEIWRTIGKSKQKSQLIQKHVKLPKAYLLEVMQKI